MKKTTEKYAAFGFGVFFVVVMLVIALRCSTPTPFQLRVFEVVLALAAAGVAAMIPGSIGFEPNKWLRAGGALAVFAIVLFKSPASLATTPPLEARVTADAGTYDTVELVTTVGSLAGEVVIDPRLAARLQGRKVELASPLRDVSLKVALDQVFGRLGVDVVYDTEDRSVVVREREPR
jgi:hypothetical protein